MKALILTAGLGTRFLPITKAVPKAMLPIGNKPVIQHLVEEALASGVTEIMIVRSPAQEVIEDHFKPNPSLEAELKARGKEESLAALEAIGRGANIHFAIQEHALGDGHAILQAKDFLGTEAFAVLFGDDIIHGPIPALKQLMDAHKEHNASILCTQAVAEADIPNYGIIGLAGQEVTSLVEKPQIEDAPSNNAIIGKYICSPSVLRALEEAQASHPDGELRLIDGFKHILGQGEKIFAKTVEGERFDTGKPEGLLKANIALNAQNSKE
jgi:UTP--glucose-1-phosphate uridylyltransferase